MENFLEYLQQGLDSYFVDPITISIDRSNLGHCVRIRSGEKMAGWSGDIKNGEMDWRAILEELKGVLQKGGFKPRNPFAWNPAIMEQMTDRILRILPHPDARIAMPYHLIRADAPLIMDWEIPIPQVLRQEMRQNIEREFEILNREIPGFQP